MQNGLVSLETWISLYISLKFCYGLWTFQSKPGPGFKKFFYSSLSCKLHSIMLFQHRNRWNARFFTECFDTFFSPLFLWCLPILKCNSAAASQVKSSWKSLWKHCDLKQPSSAQLHYRVQGKPLVAKFDAATLAVRNRLKECNYSGFHFCLKGRVAQWTHNETWERGKGKLNYI